jgi:hypothetical protein
MTLIPIFTGGGNGGFSATGGTITTAGGYKYHTFTTDGNFTVVQGTTTVEYLVVGGGGSGGAANGFTGAGQYTASGGGGGGQVIYGTQSSINMFLTIGLGGVLGNGGNTELYIDPPIGSPTRIANAFGGGYGATGTANALVGSSGGGGSVKYDGTTQTTYAAANGTSGQGFAGASADIAFPSGGGGGGAGGASAGINGGAAITTYSSWGVNAASLGAGGDGGNEFSGPWLSSYGYGSPGVYSANNTLESPLNGTQGIVIIRYAL